MHLYHFLRYKRNAFSIEETLKEDISTLVDNNEAIGSTENTMTVDTEVVNITDGVTVNIEEVFVLISKILCMLPLQNISSCIQIQTIPIPEREKVNFLLILE